MILSFAVIGINVVISLVVTIGIDIIRPKSKSMRIAQMTLFMSLSYFINMGIIPFITGNNW